MPVLTNRDFLSHKSHKVHSGVTWANPEDLSMNLDDALAQVLGELDTGSMKPLLARLVAALHEVVVKVALPANPAGDSRRGFFLRRASTHFRRLITFPESFEPKNLDEVQN